MVSWLMAPLHFLAPAVALVIAGAMLGVQRQKISRLEEVTVALKSQIAAERSHIQNQQTAQEPIPRKKPEPAKDGIDWQEIAGIFSEMRQGGGVGDMRKTMSFQSKLQKMDKDQLLAAIDEISALELGDDQRMMLEAMLIAPLALIDPELTLNRFSDRINDENFGIGWQLASAFGEWAKKDQAAAIAWFDKAIANGTFDSKSLNGRSRIRSYFETNLISRLISIDPALVKARLKALTPEQREQALSGFGFQSRKLADQAAHADLVRANLTAEKTYEVFGQQASMFAMMGGFEKVDAYLDGIGAEGEERIKTAEIAAVGKLTSGIQGSKLTEENIDTMRKWLATQAPGSVERVTGESLGKITMMNGNMNFSQAADMVLKYHAQGGGDELLTGFLEAIYYRSNKQEGARKIAEKISDPVKREQALENLK